jgi:outer membrane protein OmpA-like peptidoglycan-associated protein
MHFRVSKSLSWVLAVGTAVSLPAMLVAQDAPKPAPKAAPASDDSPSKWDIFAGYSYLAPHGDVPASDGSTFTPQSINYGSIVSISRYFNKYVGVQIEGDEHVLNQTPFSYPNCGSGCDSTYANDDFSGGSGGLVFRFPSPDVTPFVHALVGGERVGTYVAPDDVWGVVLTAGGGMDYATPFLNHHLAIRIFQADYQYSHENFGVGERGNFKIARLSAGFVYHIGTLTPPPPVTLACSAAPTTVFPGDPVTVTATAGMLDPKMNAVYSWSGEGVTGNAATATVGTTSLAPGSYTVKGTVKEGKSGKEGMKPGQSADCSASFTVKQFEPPTISCTADPTTIKPGESANITASGMSPQNRPLTYSFTASAGTVSGTGTTATFSSAGAPTGTAQITCNVSDDKGQTATANTSVTITAPYVAPIPHTKALCSITFDKDKKRPTRVDNEAKACLDEVALDLQQSADAKAVIVGESDSKEKAMTDKAKARAAKMKHAKPVVDDAAQRAVNTKEYLVTEKGIDASRISVATGGTDGQTVEDYLVPAGATFTSDVNGTTMVDETTVKAEVRKPLGAKKPMHKKAAAPAQ